ncbi:MAG TPA: hypothetical protein VF660_07585 [Actinomycetota bacterium]
MARPNAGSADDDGNESSGRLTFAKPVFVTEGIDRQAAEPSIRVDANDPTQRIWITAPSGIVPNSRSLAEGNSGDLLWYSDNNGKTWHPKSGPAGIGSPTIAGGGDSDVATGFGPEVFQTGLTLVNATLAASCDRGETFSSNPIGDIGTIQDRQWIDTWEDHAKPALGPDLLLNYGEFATERIWLHQVVAPCDVNGQPATQPQGGPPIDVTHPGCVDVVTPDPGCYQWPGNLALDERTGDVYVTYNTVGDPTHDDVIVSRVDQAGSRVATAADVHTFVAAGNRPDTFDSFTVVAVDRSSNVYVVWNERHPGRDATDVMLAFSRNRGETWSKPIRVNRAAGAHTTTFPWIVAGRKGKIDIVYYGTSASGKSPETVPNSAKWRVWMAQSLNVLSGDPDFTEVPATGYMHKGSICTSGTGCAAGTRDLLDFFQIDVDRQGLANIAYTDNLNTPPDPGDPMDATDDDPHQEWVTFVQQNGGKGIYG